MKNVFLLSSALLYLFLGNIVSANAAEPKISVGRREQRLVGTITDIKRNSLGIVDEDDKRLKWFLYFYTGKENFKISDRVRIYYNSVNNRIINVRKMTPVEYKKDGQNAGYILKREP